MNPQRGDDDRAGPHLGRIVHGALDPLLLVDGRGVVVFANPVAYGAFSPSPIGCRLDDLFTLEDSPPGGQALTDLLGNEPLRRAVVVSTREDLEVAGEIAIGSLVDGHASVVVHLAPDVQVSTIELLRRATHDDLTQLVNRTTFAERAAMELRRGGSDGHALLLVDLDGFKAVNDGFGHDTGDQVLVEIARRLRRSCRPNDVVARLGGDEFAVWCPSLHDDHTASQLASRLLAAIREPIQVGEHATALSASIGIVLTTGGLHEVGELLSKADAAMYRAKAEGRAGFDVYDEDLGVAMLRQRTLESTLTHAIAKDQLVLHCEAMVNLIDRRPVGAEALVRWEHPHLGRIAPTEFAPVAARVNAQRSLNDWALAAVCGELAAWNDMLAEPLILAIDVSTDLLCDALVNKVEDLLASHGIEPGQISFEIDEEQLSVDEGSALAVLADLRSIGVGITIDNYGVGGLPLGSLHEIPADVLKLDRSLAAGIGGSKRQQALVEGIIAIAHGLDLRVIASGVAHEADLATLRDLGCDCGQGPIISRVGPVGDTTWMAAVPDLRLR